MGQAKINPLVYFCFFLSGASALIYEIVWSRLLTTIFGASLYAVATVSGVFLLGLALGAFLGGRFRPKSSDDTGRAALWIYICLEIAITMLGAALPYIAMSDPIQGAWFSFEQQGRGAFATYLARFLFACVLLLPPTTLMGATFPMLVDAIGDGRSDRTQALYAANTAGGAMGALLGGFLFIPNAGLAHASLFAAVGNLVAALVAYMVARGKLPVREPPPVTANPLPQIAPPFTMYGVTILSGLLLLSMEVAWTRWFNLLLGSSVYSFATVLFLFLIALALGAWLVERFIERIGNHLLLIATAYFLSATYILITLYCADELPWLFISLIQSFSMSGVSFEATLAARMVMVATVMSVPALLMGMVFPILLGAKSMHKPKLVGTLYAMNTIGCVLGAWLTGFFLIPFLSRWTVSGIQMTMLISVILQVSIAMWLFSEWCRWFITDTSTRAIVIGIAGFVLVAIMADVALFRPEWNPAVMSAGGTFFSHADIARLDRESFLNSVGMSPSDERGPIVFYREGLNSTVTVAQDDRRNVTYLKTDGKVEAALPTDPLVESQGADTTTHLLLGALPVALSPAAAESVLIIGLGTGTTAGAALVNDRVRQLTVVELEPAVLAAAKFFSSSNGNPVQQGLRTRILVNDGRYVLTTRDTKYDAIECQPSDPWVAGSSDLFTQEFWTLARSRLNADGVMGQWVQLYSIKPAHFAMLCRTFQSVFPNTALVCPKEAGECVLIGSTSAETLTPEKLRSALATETATAAHLPASYPSLSSRVHASLILGPSQIKALVDEVGSQSGITEINTVNWNKVEFAAARDAMTQEQNIVENISLIEKFSKQPVLSR